MNWTDQDIDRLFQGAKAPEPPPFEENFWTEMEAMLPENVEVDALFQGVQAPAPPPFQEAYWTEMETMLPRKKRRAAAIWWFSGGAAMVALMLSAWYFAGSGTAANDRGVASRNVTGETNSGESSASVNTVGTNDEISTESHYTGTKVETQDLASLRYAPVQQQVEMPSDPAQQETVRHAEITPEQTAGTISATTGTVSPLNPLPFEYALDEVAARLPETKQPRPARFYAQLSMGAGQSAQRNVIGSSDFLHYYAVGGGLYTRVDNMVLTFGLNGRVDFTDNIVRTVGTETPGNRIETSYKQLYSIETPASLGYSLGRNVFTATVTPGFQTGFSGQEREYVAETQVRSEQASGRVKNSRTLTMEFGLSYWRVLQPDWQLGAAVNFDALRPFNNSLFAGEQRMAPLNGQIILRRTF